MSGSWYNKFRRITSNQLYFPEIDGIRFLAIALVILFHTHGYFVNKTHNKFIDWNNNYDWINNFLNNGDRGVVLFFVLSGFILCLPFAHYYINNGKKVLLKKYFLRRLTRLEPPYIIAMLIIFVLEVCMNVHPAKELLPHLFASLTYTHNVIYRAPSWLTVVAWSLEIEIQFYLLAPLFFKLLALPKVWRRTALVSIIIGLTVLEHVWMPYGLRLSIYLFAPYFLSGILLADLYVSNTASDLFNKKWVVPASIILFLVLCYYPVEYKYSYRMIMPFLICGLYYMILKNDTLKKVFSYKVIPVIGGMCYSIYLLHYTIIAIVGRYTTGIRVTHYYLPNLFLQMILLAIPVIVLSTVYYYYIERPFMDNKWMKMLMKKDKPAEGEATGNI